jgi:hypothetical protein|nr:MAG TPA: threonine dehydratase regulatory domain protein [Caudoviricetes sp.]
MMGKLVKADEAGLEPFIEELNGCINAFASDGYGGARIAVDVLPRNDKQQKRLIKLLREAGYETVWTDDKSVLNIIWV